MGHQAYKVFYKELNKLARDIDSLTCGQAKIAERDANKVDSEEIEEKDANFFVDITPNGGFYKGATCKFEIAAGPEYPSVAPTVHCLNTVYHPNIDIVDENDRESFSISGASVCVNLLDSDWTADVGLDGCVMALLFLFHNPNFEDPLSPLFEGEDAFDMSNKEIFEKIRNSLRGGEIDSVTFDKLLDDDFVDEEFVDENDQTADSKIIGENGDDVTNTEGASTSQTASDSFKANDETSAVVTEVSPVNDDTPAAADKSKQMTATNQNEDNVMNDGVDLNSLIRKNVAEFEFTCLAQNSREYEFVTMSFRELYRS